MSSSTDGYAVTQIAAYPGPYDMPVFSAQAAADLQALRDSINAEVPAHEPNQEMVSEAATLAFHSAHENMRTVKQLMEAVTRMGRSQKQSTLDGIRAHEWKSFIESLSSHIGKGPVHGPIADVLLKSMQSHLDKELDKGIDAVFQCTGPGWALHKDIPAHVRYPTRELLWEDGIVKDGQSLYPFAHQAIRDYFLKTQGDSYSITQELSLKLIAIELVDGNELNPDMDQTQSYFPVYYNNEDDEEDPIVQPDFPIRVAKSNQRLQAAKSEDKLQRQKAEEEGLRKAERKREKQRNQSAEQTEEEKRQRAKHADLVRRVHEDQPRSTDEAKFPELPRAPAQTTAAVSSEKSKTTKTGAIWHPSPDDAPKLTHMPSHTTNACMMFITFPCRLAGSQAIHSVTTSISLVDASHASSIMKHVHAGGKRSMGILKNMGVLPDESSIEIVSRQELIGVESHIPHAHHNLVGVGEDACLAIVTRQSFPLRAARYNDTDDYCVETIQSLVLFPDARVRSGFVPLAQNLLLCNVTDGRFKYDDTKTSVVWLDALPKRIVQTYANPLFRTWNFKLHREKAMHRWQSNRFNIQSSLLLIAPAIAHVLAYEGPWTLVCHIPQTLHASGRDIMAEYTVNLGDRRATSTLFYTLRDALNYKTWITTPISTEIKNAEWFCFVVCKDRMASDAAVHAYHWDTRFQRTSVDGVTTALDTDIRMSVRTPPTHTPFLETVVLKAYQEARIRPYRDAWEVETEDIVLQRDNNKIYTNQRLSHFTLVANSNSLNNVIEVIESVSRSSSKDKPFLAFLKKLRSRWYA